MKRPRTPLVAIAVFTAALFLALGAVRGCVKAAHRLSPAGSEA